jgi:hypothetical protein
MLRHALATLAYRAERALHGAPEGFADFRAGDGSRTPREILAHMGDLMEWALSLANGAQIWKESSPLTWEDEIERFFLTLEALDDRLDSEEPLARPEEKLFHGPVADALTHTGQLTYLRRLAGSPVQGENYFKASIMEGKLRPEA